MKTGRGQEGTVAKRDVLRKPSLLHGQTEGAVAEADPCITRALSDEASYSLIDLNWSLDVADVVNRYSFSAALSSWVFA